VLVAFKLGNLIYSSVGFHADGSGCPSRISKLFTRREGHLGVFPSSSEFFKVFLGILYHWRSQIRKSMLGKNEVRSVKHFLEDVTDFYNGRLPSLQHKTCSEY